METRKGRWFGWKFWRLFLLITASLITLVALFYAEEDWRGKRAWENYKTRMEAQGVNFDFSKYVPPRVPDDQNFAMTPFFAPLFDFIPGTQHMRDTNTEVRIYKALSLPSKVRETLGKGGWSEGKPLDLVRLANAWRQTNHLAPSQFFPGQTKEAARAILVDLKSSAPIFDELRSASRRPYSRFNINYEWEPKLTIILPHYGYIGMLRYQLKLRACAELALGQSEPAFQDTQLMFYLCDCIRNEPFLDSQFVRAGSLSVALQPIWEGLARHQWSDVQLAAFEKNLQGLNFVEAAPHAWADDRSLGDAFFEGLRRTRNPFSFLDHFSMEGVPLCRSIPLGWVVFLVPRGWFYLDELNFQREYDEETKNVITTNGIDPVATDLNSAILLKKYDSETDLSALLHHQLITRALLELPEPRTDIFGHQMACAQDEAGLALVGCALERYRLANGQFPESLDTLVPRFLTAVPHDAIAGESFSYHRTDDGNFILYSVGWDKKSGNRRPLTHPDTQWALWGGIRWDWRWEYPPT